MKICSNRLVSHFESYYNHHHACWTEESFHYFNFFLFYKLSVIEPKCFTILDTATNSKVHVWRYCIFRRYSSKISTEVYFLQDLYKFWLFTFHTCKRSVLKHGRLWLLSMNDMEIKGYGLSGNEWLAPV